MLTIIILTLLFGGGSIEIFSSDNFLAVESAVDDPVRIEAATQSMERVNAKLESLVQQRDEYFEALSDINRRIDAPADEYEAVIDRLWDARRSAIDTYVDEVFVLRETMSREEWGAAFSTP
jgi:hypothetical protein